MDKVRCRKDIDNNGEMNSVMNEWNKLSIDYVGDANTIKRAEWRLDIFMNGEGSWCTTITFSESVVYTHKSYESLVK